MTSPVVVRHGDSWVLTWPEHELGIGIDKTREGRESALTAEVVVEAVQGEQRRRILGPVNLNLTSLRSQTEFVNALAKRIGTILPTDLHTVVVHACAIVAKGFREASPSVKIAQEPDSPGVEYLVPGLIPDRETTILYGDGESAKSLLGLRIALSVSTGIPLPWGTYVEIPRPVLILDWETNSRTIRNRLKRLAAGMSIPIPENIHYRGDVGRGGVLRSIDEELDNIRQQVTKDSIGFILVDSIGFAVNGPLTEDMTARSAVNALRQMAPTTRLVIAHVSVASANQPTGKVRPFGSTFFWNGMRSGIEVRRSEVSDQKDQINLAMYHRKSNDETHHKTIGLSVKFGTDICVVPLDVQSVADLAARTPLSQRIYAALRAGAKTTAELADEFETKEATVRTTLNAMPGVVNLTPGGGRGRSGTWGILSSNG